MPARAAAPRAFDAHLAGDRRHAVRARIDADQLIVDDGGGTTVRELHLDDIAEVRRDGATVRIETTVGAPLGLECEDAEVLDTVLVGACCTLPELTRALHSLGSSRARSDAAGQREFLAPLLDARRRAEESVGRSSIVGAFDTERLARALDAYLAALTLRTGDVRPAARRAFAAAAEDAVAPMREALEAVRRAADGAANPPADSRVGSWRRWQAALQGLFGAADRSWIRLDRSFLSDRPSGG